MREVEYHSADSTEWSAFRSDDAIRLEVGRDVVEMESRAAHAKDVSDGGAQVEFTEGLVKGHVVRACG